ncbi:MAG: class I SAM-dependent methyltransferase, partial [Candidatus Hinthialibacter sp.]
MTDRTGDSKEERLKRYYQTSVRYRDDLITHDESFLQPFLILVDRYLNKGSQILDLGCGAGLSARLLTQNGYKTCGLDISPLFLSVEKHEHPETNLIAGNALQLPFYDSTFDAVVAFEFIEHIPNV